MFARAIAVVLVVLITSSCENKKQTEEIEALKSELEIALNSLDNAAAEIADLSNQVAVLNDELNTMRSEEAARQREAAEREEAARLASLNVDISDDCTVNGFGRVSCTFQNSGTGTGSICVVPYLNRIFQGERAEGRYENRYYDEYPGIEAKGEVCSGLVRGGDVVERTKQLSFTVTECDRMICPEVSPSVFCSVKHISSWHQGCRFGTREASR